MRASDEVERRRAGVGLGALTGTLLAFPAGMWTLPALGVPAGFLVLGIVVGAPVFLLMVQSLGVGRALTLSIATGAIAAGAFAVLAAAACLATGCVG